MQNKLIFHADDLGLTLGFNDAINESHLSGVLTSASIRTNAPAFHHAVQKVVKPNPHLSIGVHLNLVEGEKSESNNRNFDILCHHDGTFKLGFIGLFRKSFSNSFLKQVEVELEEQIAKASACVGQITHLDSHKHCCAIPKIFNIVCKLATRHNIKSIRMANETFVLGSKFWSSSNPFFSSNIIKWATLNILALWNKKTAKKYGLTFPDHFVGVLHTGKMNLESCTTGIKKVLGGGKTIEILLHPSSFTGNIEEHYLNDEVRDYCLSPRRDIEKQTLLSNELKDFISNNDIILSNRHSETVFTLTNNENNFATKKRTILIFDETPFFHPRLMSQIITKDNGINVVGIVLVKLQGGGLLKRYLLSKWPQVGIYTLLKLALRSYSFAALGRFSKIFKCDFNSSCISVAKINKTPFLVTSELKSDVTKNWLRNLTPEYIVSSNSLIFDKELLTIPSVKCINRHSSLLPANGGILPVFRSIQFGHSHTGVTIHEMTTRIDEGKILHQFPIPIYKGDTIYKLYKHCFNLSYFLIVDAINEIIRDSSIETNLSNIGKSYFSYPMKPDWIEFNKAKIPFM